MSFFNKTFINTFQYYTFQQVKDLFKLKLIKTKGKTTNTFDIPTCGYKNATIYKNDVKIIHKSLLIHIKNLVNNKHILMNLNLSSLFNYKYDYSCTEVAAVSFGEHMIYIYKVESGRILRRSTVTPDGEEIDSFTFDKTEFVCFFFICTNQCDIQPIRDVEVDGVVIKLIMLDGNIPRAKNIIDKPRCHPVQYETEN